jgi:hypothetical protein
VANCAQPAAVGLGQDLADAGLRRLEWDFEGREVPIPGPGNLGGGMSRSAAGCSCHQRTAVPSAAGRDDDRREPVQAAVVMIAQAGACET